MPQSSSTGAVAEGAGEVANVQTVIFVDVDGVLNVGARDDATRGGPLLLNVDNINRARSMVRHNQAKTSECAQKIMALSSHAIGPSEDGTYTKLVANSSNISEVCVGRLADLIKATQPRPRVVLSSSWRHVKHSARRERLRQDIQERLGYDFKFDDMTPIRDDTCAPGRLACIAEYLQSLELPAAPEVRLLVLDDFFITPMRGWSCSGFPMDSVEDAERFLLSSCSLQGSVKVKVVHPYTEFASDEGLLVQVGSGLTLEHFQAAVDFLTGQESGTCTSRAPSKRGFFMSKVASSTLLTKLRNHASNSKQRISPEINLARTDGVSKASSSNSLHSSSSAHGWISRMANALSIASPSS